MGVLLISISNIYCLYPPNPPPHPLTDELHERVLLVGVHFGHEPVIQNANAAVGGAEEVAGVGVGVQESGVE